METRAKTNQEFRHEVHEILASHETRFDQILTELQALRMQQTRPSTENRTTIEKEINPFSIGEAIHSEPSAFAQSNFDRNHIHLKLNFPTYGGDDPVRWIFKAEQYFDFKGIDSQQQVQLASFHLEGVALLWYRWYTKFWGLMSWNEFTKAIFHQFGPTDYDDPSEALFPIFHFSFIFHYSIRSAENHKITIHLITFTPPQIVKFYFSHISYIAKIHYPKSGMLHKQTTTVNAYQEAFEKLSHRVDNLPENFLVGNVRVKQPKTLSETINVAHLIEERNLLQRRTGAPFRPAATSEEAIPEISFHALAGTIHPQTFRVIGRIGNRELTVLIDRGSTHNFLDQMVVTIFGLPVIRDKVFQVTVGNKEIIECTGRCLGLSLTIQGFIVRADFYVLPVAACQAVLGVQCLET
ncbi:hypothetical protein ACOSQ4_004193 [Xanthoceras sorbifolium]